MFVYFRGNASPCFFPRFSLLVRGVTFSEVCFDRAVLLNDGVRVEQRHTAQSGFHPWNRLQCFREAAGLTPLFYLTSVLGWDSPPWAGVFIVAKLLEHVRQQRVCLLDPRRGPGEWRNRREGMCVPPAVEVNRLDPVLLGLCRTLRSNVWASWTASFLSFQLICFLHTGK